MWTTGTYEPGTRGVNDRYAPGVSGWATGGHSESESASAACVRLLGAVRFVSQDGETIELPSARQRRLVALHEDTERILPKTGKDDR